VVGMSPDEFMREYEAVANAHDLERMLMLIDDEAVYWFSDGTTHSGRQAIASALQHNFSAIAAETYRMTSLTWLLRTDSCAVCTYEFAWSGRIGGVPAAGSGRGTSVLTRRTDRWVVRHEHLSKGRA